MSQNGGTYTRGVLAVEALIGVAIATMILIYSTHTITRFVNSARDVSGKTEALFLAEEGLELVRYLRDNSWTNISSLSLNTTYYLSVTSTTIRSTTTPEVINYFTRSFSIQNVYREPGTDDVVASTTSGSVADTSSKYITVTVSGSAPTTSISLTTILTDIGP